MNRFKRFVTVFVVASCLPVCSASLAQTTDASKKTTPPKTAAEFKQRGEELAGKRQYEMAIADFDAARRLAPQDIAILLARGKARLANWEPDHAIADANAMIKIDSAPIISAAGHFTRRTSWMRR